MEAGTIDGIDVCNHCGGQMNQTTNEGRCMQCGAFDETTCENCGKRLYTNVDALLCKCGFEDLPGAGTVRFRLVRLN